MRHVPVTQGNEGAVARLYFVPNETFEERDPEGRLSVYVKGMNYNVRNPALEARARRWEAAGKVRFVSTPRATTHGRLETR